MKVYKHVAEGADMAALEPGVLALTGVLGRLHVPFARVGLSGVPGNMAPVDYTPLLGGEAETLGKTTPDVDVLDVKEARKLWLQTLRPFIRAIRKAGCTAALIFPVRSDYMDYVVEICRRSGLKHLAVIVYQAN